MEVRIIGICPVIDRYDEDGMYIGPSSFFGYTFQKPEKSYQKLKYLITEKMMLLV